MDVVCVLFVYFIVCLVIFLSMINFTFDYMCICERRKEADPGLVIVSWWSQPNSGLMPEQHVFLRTELALQRPPFI